MARAGVPVTPSAPPRVFAASGAGSRPESLLHDRIRLGIVSALAGTEVLTFVELKQLLDTTDGNLSVHARKLEEAGYVTCTKGFANRRPRTDYRLTAVGRRALQHYLDHMEALIEATRRSMQR
jgi:DNA-binding MarR family transcriptional regulator